MHAAEHHQPIYSYIGQRIRERRKRLKLNQSDLAGLMGFSYQQMQKYETGHSRVSAGKLLLFAKILNVPPSYFYDGIKLDEAVGAPIESNVIQRNRARPLRILLVENNPADVLAFQKVINISGSGAEAQIVHDGETALKQLHHDDTRFNYRLPDIIVLELDLPQLDGIELLKALKQHARTAGVPVIILTNSINAKDMAEAYRRGAAGFIQKSVDAQEYAEGIKTMVKYWSKTVALPS